MSANNLPTTLPSVEKLAQRLIAAERSNQKEIRLTLQEARDLSTELSILTAKMGQYIAEIHQKLSEMQQSSEKIEIKFDGGGFGQG